MKDKTRNKERLSNVMCSVMFQLNLYYKEALENLSQEAKVYLKNYISQIKFIMYYINIKDSYSNAKR